MSKSTAILLLAGLSLLSLPASAEDDLVAPQWLRKPSVAGLQRLFPRAAWEAGVDGRAVIECTATADGTLADCVIVSETPPGYGFGQATVRAAAKFRMKPQTVTGEPVAGKRVRIPLSWRRA